MKTIEQLQEEFYRKVYIKDISDLPKNIGNYPVHQKGFEPDYVMSMYYNGLPNNFWLQAYDWYLQPLAESQEQSEREENLIELVRIARKGSHVTSELTGTTYWKFDIDSEKKVIDEYRKQS